MNTLNRVSGTILVISALGIVIGLPIFAGLRDSKALKSTAPICAPQETIEECLPPLPPIV